MIKLGNRSVSSYLHNFLVVPDRPFHSVMTVLRSAHFLTDDICNPDALSPPHNMTALQTPPLCVNPSTIINQELSHLFISLTASPVTLCQPSLLLCVYSAPSLSKAVAILTFLLLPRNAMVCSFLCPCSRYLHRPRGASRPPRSTRLWRLGAGEDCLMKASEPRKHRA
jgi:hypothetical protein